MKYPLILWAPILFLLGATAFAAQPAPADVDLSAQYLHAGPIHAKLQDGQMRYLRVGDKEIIRRIYFGVRDATWATAMPKYTLMNVDKADDHFTVHMAADCKMGKVDLSWTGTIIGTADGKITFTAEGTPNADFESNRIGLCVLYGTPSLATQAFETDGTPAKGVFPPLVSAKHVADQFHRLQYATPGGMTVACSVDGAIFDMEDQRNWGDSSWKAFAPLPYAYTHVGKGDVKSETVTVSVTGVDSAAAQHSPRQPVEVSIGQPMPGMKIPELLPAGTIIGSVPFTPISFHRDVFKDKDRIDWSYIPTTHLPDDDTVMENLPTVTDQANTARAFASGSTELRVGPIRFEGTGTDARANAPIAVAWQVGMVNYLARGQVPAAEFGLKGEWADAALDAVRPYAHWPLMEVETSPKDSTHVLAFGCGSEARSVIFLVNKTSRASSAVLKLGRADMKVLRVAPGAKEEPVEVPADGLKVELAPYEVYRVSVMKRG